MPKFKFDFSDEAALTNSELAGELSKHTVLTKTQLEELLPKREDLGKLKELIELVNSAASHNNKLAALQANFQELGGVAIKLLGHIIKV